MKLMRVLTGFHAGAQISIATGIFRVGRSLDADIRITDWQDADIVLRVNEGVVTVEQDCEIKSRIEDGDREPDSGNEFDNGIAPRSTTDNVYILADFAPAQFGDTIFCVGEEAAEWPSDIQILSSLLECSVERDQSKVSARRDVIAMITGSLLIGLFAGIGIFLNTMKPSHAAIPINILQGAQRVQAAFVAARLNELHARVVGKTIVVSGMVAGEADDRAVHKIVASVIPNVEVECNYDIAQEVTQSIGDMLHIDGAYATYLGNARFIVNGPTSQKVALAAAVADVRRDLSENIEDIELRTNGPTVLSSGIAYSELLASDSVRFWQTPDGIKHIFNEDAASESQYVSPQIDNIGMR